MKSNIKTLRDAAEREQLISKAERKAKIAKYRAERAEKQLAERESIPELTAEQLGEQLKLLLTDISLRTSRGKMPIGVTRQIHQKSRSTYQDQLTANQAEFVNLFQERLRLNEQLTDIYTKLRDNTYQVSMSAKEMTPLELKQLIF